MIIPTTNRQRDISSFPLTTTRRTSRKVKLMSAVCCGLFLSNGRSVVLATSSNHHSSPTASSTGLSVTGGSSRLKKYARRVRAFREVRVDSPPPPLPISPEYDESEIGASPIIRKEEEEREDIDYQTSLSVDALQPKEGDDPIVVATTRPLPPQAQVVPVVTASSSQSNYITPDNNNNNNSRISVVYMGLLALQFGIQPMLVRNFTPRGICKSSVVLTQEIFKFGLASIAYLSTTNEESRTLDRAHLTLKSWLTMAGLPACLYTIQNLMSLMAYQNLEALTFNILNQTKILSAALCCYFIMGKKQSIIQSLSLVLLLLSALVIEQVVTVSSLLSGSVVDSVKGVWGVLGSGGSEAFSTRFTYGVVPVLVASFLSGLNGALTQRNLQGSIAQKRRPKNSYMFSMELCAASSAVLLLSLLVSRDGKMIASNGFFHNWQSPKVLIPIVTNSLGGILVGLVTKHAGSVRKGFALIFGIFVSGLLQSEGVSTTQWLGGVMAAISLWMHATNPHSEPAK